MNKQKILVSLTTVVLAGSTLFAVPQIYAQTPGTSPHMNFFQELVAFISQKFGLDKTQVQSAVTTFQQQRKTTVTPRPTLTPDQIAAQEKTRLDALVTAGKITSNQETAIINELAALRTKYSATSMNGLTPAERKTQMTAQRDEIVAWAKSQGIDSSYIMGGFGMGDRGPGMGGGRGKSWGK
jgi:hypothetical protein